MNYFIIVGEASGDLHAAHLMQAIKKYDSSAEFQFYGGELMSQVGGTCLKHYKELAYMGFIPVLLHLPTILKNMKRCKEQIKEWSPDVVLLVDYPGFNLNIAEYVKQNTTIPVYYYIAPKIWAWKEHRIKSIQKNVDELFSILPFEIDFFENKHHYPIHYVGNPTMEEITAFQEVYNEDFFSFCQRNDLAAETPVLALLAGSRKQEIKDNLGRMYEASKEFIQQGLQLVLAGAPNISPAFYQKVLAKYPGAEQHIKVVFNQTYPLLTHSSFALVTSGTATLETALFNVPQIVCYYAPLGKLVSFLRKKLIKVKYISLVNLIADKEIIPELVADTMTVKNLNKHLHWLVDDKQYREEMLRGYQLMRKLIGTSNASYEAAQKIVTLLKEKKRIK